MTIYKRNYELEKAANALAPTNQQFNFDNFQNNFSMKHSDIFKLTFKDAHLYKVKEAVLSLLEGWNLVHPNNLLGTVGVMYYEQDSKNVVLELYFYVYNEDGIPQYKSVFHKALIYTFALWNIFIDAGFLAKIPDIQILGNLAVFFTGMYLMYSYRHIIFNKEISLLLESCLLKIRKTFGKIEE